MTKSASATTTKVKKESTRDVLIRTAVAMIDEFGEPHLRLEVVLERSGASVSSLYHYFGNLDGLLRAANIARFNRYAFADIEYLRRRTEETKSKDDFRMLAPDSARVVLLAGHVIDDELLRRRFGHRFVVVRTDDVDLVVAQRARTHVHDVVRVVDAEAGKIESTN